MCAYRGPVTKIHFSTTRASGESDFGLGDLPPHHHARFGNTISRFCNAINRFCDSVSANPNYANFQVPTDALPIMHDNRVYTLDGRATENGKDVSEWQAQGHDLGTVVAPMLADEVIVQMARDLLRI